MTISKSSNGSIVVNQPQSESVSLLNQFKRIKSNIVKIQSSSRKMEFDLKNLKQELNNTKSDFETEISIVSVCLLFTSIKIRLIHRKISMELQRFLPHAKNIMTVARGSMVHIKFDRVLSFIRTASYVNSLKRRA